MPNSVMDAVETIRRLHVSTHHNPTPVPATALGSLEINSDSDTVGSAFNMPLLKGEKSDLLVSNSFVGVEVEVENLPTIQTKTRNKLQPEWKIVEDNSLRNNGREFVFAAPLRGEDVVNALSKLNTYLSKTPAQLTERCSVHVHLDTRDMSVQQIRNLTFLYILLEEIMFHEAGIHRKDNIYALPLMKSDDYLRRIAFFLKNKDFRGYKHIVSDDKYSAFNLKTIGTLGTIEFRHHEGCYNKDKLLKWINLILSLKTAAVNSDDLDINSVQNMLDTGQIFPYISELFPDETIDLHNFNDTVYSAAKTLKKLMSYMYHDFDGLKRLPSNSIKNPLFLEKLHVLGGERGSALAWYALEYTLTKDFMDLEEIRKSSKLDKLLKNRLGE